VRGGEASSCCAQPFRRVYCGAAAPDLEVQMGPERGIADADSSERLTFDYSRPFPDIYPVE